MAAFKIGGAAVSAADVLALIRLGRVALEQIRLMGVDELDPDVRAAILEEKARLDDEWRRLAPPAPESD